MEGIRERRKPWKKWNYELEEDLKIIGIRNLYTVAIDRKEWRKILLEAKVHKGL
jgi:hypothetical protein